MSEVKSKMVKTPLILPEVLIKEIDRLMGKRKRSKFVTEVVQKELKRIRLQRALERCNVKGEREALDRITYIHIISYK